MSSSSASLVAPSALWFDHGGGQAVVQVGAGSGTDWHATSDGAWVTFPAGPSGVGRGSFSVSTLTNSSEPRAARISVRAGEETATTTVVQLAPPSWYEAIVLACELPVIEQKALLGFIKQIDEAPPPARPPLFAALMAAIEGAGAAAEGLYRAHPAVPQTYTASFLLNETREAVSFVAEHISGK